jgi:hypothetical protein
LFTYLWLAEETSPKFFFRFPQEAPVITDCACGVLAHPKWGLSIYCLFSPCLRCDCTVATASLSWKHAILHRGPQRLALLPAPVLFTRSNIVLPLHAGSLTPSPEIENPESCSRNCIVTSTAILVCAFSQHLCLFGEINSRCFSGFFSRCFTAF